MDGSGEQTELLRNIWGEMRSMHAGLGRRIDGLRGELKAEMAELRGEVVELRGELKAEMAELRGEVVELRGEVVELRGEVVELRGEVRTLSVRFDNFLVGEHRRDHIELHERVARLEEHAGLRPPGG
jgi:predicted nuclease with TOPRIM domain